MPECGESGRWHNLPQFHRRSSLCAIEEANIGVLQPSENLHRCKWGIFNVNWACREFLLFFFLQSHFIGTYIAWALHCAVLGTSIWRVVPWHKLWYGANRLKRVPVVLQNVMLYVIRVRIPNRVKSISQGLQFKSRHQFIFFVHFVKFVQEILQ